jgi:hypothetical protein
MTTAAKYVLVMTLLGSALAAEKSPFHSQELNVAPSPSPQNHFPYLHRPLHRGLRVGLHAPLGLLLVPPAKRTDHVLNQPDISVLPTRLKKWLDNFCEEG